MFRMLAISALTEMIVSQSEAQLPSFGLNATVCLQMLARNTLKNKGAITLPCLKLVETWNQLSCLPLKPASHMHCS